MKPPKETVFICQGKKCTRNNQKNLVFLQQELSDHSLDSFVKIKKMKCQKMCKHAPVYFLKSKDSYKKEVAPKKIKKWVKKWEKKIKTYFILAIHK